MEYQVIIDDKKINFCLEGNDDTYPKYMNLFGKDNFLLWNWDDECTYFSSYLWSILDDNGMIKERSNERFYQPIEFNDLEYADKHMVRIFEHLNMLGYLQLFEIVPEQIHPLWQYWTAEDKIGLILLDKSFLKNKLTVEQVKVLVNCEERDLNLYILTDENNKLYLSPEPGILGGHYKLKIYGKLDCKSALSYIEKGEYVKNRVFFKDEKTAIAAGYRPCCKCMPDEYKKWKEQNI